MTNSPILQEKLVLIRMSKETEYNLQQLRIKSAKANFTEDIIFHCKTKRKHNTMDPLLHEKIHGFYNKDVVSWVLPYNDLLNNIKLSNGKIRVLK